MSIIRTEKRKNPYVTIDKTALNDRRLSWKAKGLHAYMMSMPDDWRFYREELANHAKDGVDAVKSAFKELTKCGYMKRQRYQDEQGKFKWETVIYETPQPVEEKPEGEKPPTEKPQGENPPVGKPPAGNPLVDKTQLLSNKELSNESLSNYIDDDGDARADHLDIEQDLKEMDQEPSPQPEENPVTKYQELFGKFPSQIVIQEMHAYIDNGVEPAAVCLAIEKAAKNDQHFGYARGILNSWEDNNIKTLEQAKADSDKGAKNYAAHRRGNGGNNAASEAYAAKKRRIAERKRAAANNV